MNTKIDQSQGGISKALHLPRPEISQLPPLRSVFKKGTFNEKGHVKFEIDERDYFDVN